MLSVKKLLTSGFLLIPEPRVIRLLMMCIYITFLCAGVLVFRAPNASILQVLGDSPWLITAFAGFLSFGGLLGVIAVMPGIWWLERAGIVSAGTGTLIFCVILCLIGSSSLGLPIGVAMLFFLLIRWMEIRRFQLAPRE